MISHTVAVCSRPPCSRRHPRPQPLRRPLEVLHERREFRLRVRPPPLLHLRSGGGDASRGEYSEKRSTRGRRGAGGALLRIIAPRLERSLHEHRLEVLRPKVRLRPAAHAVHAPNRLRARRDPAPGGPGPGGGGGPRGVPTGVRVLRGVPVPLRAAAFPVQGRRDRRRRRRRRPRRLRLRRCAAVRCPLRPADWLRSQRRAVELGQQVVQLLSVRLRTVPDTRPPSITQEEDQLSPL